MKPVVIHAAARAELEESITFYESRARGLGLEFQSQVEDAIANIQRNPQTWPSHKESGFRKYLVDRFPFTVFFKETSDSIWIAAVAHHKRRPDYWRRRRPS